MAGPTGINPITGFVITRPELSAAQVQGNIADPKHAIAGETTRPYPWESPMMGAQTSYPPPLSASMDNGVGEPVQHYIPPAGVMAQDPTSDQTPAYHAAPFPKEGPGSVTADQLDVSQRATGSARQLLESAWVHAHRTGAGLKKLFLPQMFAKQDEWTGFFNPVQGEDQVPDIPGQVSNAAFGINVNDRVSNQYAKKNAFGFNTAHRHRRFATGPIPGNTMWMRPGGRPMVRSFTGIHNFPLSGAFANDDPGATFGYQGAILQNVPSEYVTPPQPSLSSAQVGDASANQTVPEIPLY